MVCSFLHRALSKLYADANWSQKDLTETVEDVRRNVTKNKMSSFSFSNLAFYQTELSKREEMGYKTSFTDLWGLAIESMMYDKVSEPPMKRCCKVLLPTCTHPSSMQLGNTTTSLPPILVNA